MSRAPSRYRTPGMEGEWEPGSGRRVLRNLKGIRKKTEMDRAEADALLAAEEKYLGIVAESTVVAGYAQNYVPLADFFAKTLADRLRELEE